MSVATGTAAERRAATLAALREEFGAMLGAERRLRGRDQHREKGTLTSAHVRALFALGAHEEATAGQIAESARLSPGAVTGMLDELEAAGIVRRVRCPDDRRRVLVSLTEEGATLLDEKRRGWARRWEEALADLPEGDLEAASRVMGRVAAMIDGL